MDQDEARRMLARGELAVSKHPRDFTISVGPAGRPPQDGEIWILAGSPYLLRGVTGSGASWSGKLHYLTEALPGDASVEET